MQDQRTVGQVEEGKEVDRVGVGGQEQRSGVHQLREDQYVAVHDPGVEEPLSDGVRRHPLDRVHERLDTVQVVQMVTQPRRGISRRVAVGELQDPDPRLHPRRRRHLWWDDRPLNFLGSAHQRLLTSRSISPYEGRTLIGPLSALADSHVVLETLLLVELRDFDRDVERIDDLAR